MDHQDKQSLRRYLTVPNPSLTSRKTPGRTNSVNRSWASPTKLRIWEDFNLSSLQSMYGGELRKVLDKYHTFHNFSDLPQYPFCQIADESSLERFLVKWTQSVITEALQVAQTDGLFKKSGTIYMVCGGQAMYKSQSNLKPTEGTKKKLYPDWAAVKFHEPELRPIDRLDLDPGFGATYSLLPGDTKIGAKWTSAKIQPGLFRDLGGPESRPVQQIFNYCLATHSRYGYLITDEELFVIRVRPSQDSLDEESHVQANLQSSASVKGKENKEDDIVERTRKSGVVEYKSIPWKESGEGNLTVNLALFWLHMLASVENEIRERYGNLSQERLGAVQQVFPSQTLGQGQAATSSLNHGYSKLKISDRTSSRNTEPQQPVSQAHSGRERKRSRPADQRTDARKKRSHRKSDQ